MEENQSLITFVENEARVDSRIIAKGLGISHKAFIQTLRKYQKQMEILGGFAISNAETSYADGGRPETLKAIHSVHRTKFKALVREFEQLKEEFNEIRKEMQNNG